jgi:hypothetical protein
MLECVERLCAEQITAAQTASKKELVLDHVPYWPTYQSNIAHYNITIMNGHISTKPPYFFSNDASKWEASLEIIPRVCSHQLSQALKKPSCLQSVK